MKVEDMFKRLKPYAGKSLDVLWYEYILSDTKTQKQIEAVLHMLMARSFDETFEEREILLEPPQRDTAEGEYKLGMIHYGKEQFHPFGLREHEWIQHVGIFGRSGSGKTNLAYIIVLEYLKQGKKFLIFDWKRNYRDLLDKTGKEILIFTVGRDVSPFHFNPLIPPGSTSPAIWLKKIIEIMCHAYFLGEGVAFLLQNAIDSVYADFGVYCGKIARFPNLMDVKEWLENHKAKGREGEWMKSALRAIGVLCFGEVGKVLNNRVSSPLEELLERNVILELDALTNPDKTFLIESLLLWIHHYRMGEGERERFKHAIIVEEAHHILLRKKQEVMGEETVTDVILREIRELGESIVLIDQHPSLISKPALGNTYCTVVMNLKHRADINMIADSLLLETREKRYLGRLETGWAMVKLQGRWFTPFLVRFPQMDIRKGYITDEKVKESMNQFWEVITPASEVITPRKEKTEEITAFSGKEKRMKLGEEENRLVMDIESNVSSSTTERYKRIGLNARKGNKVKDSLIRKGLIESKDMSTGTGRIKLLVLTEKGQTVLKSKGNPNIGSRKGGLEHVYWINRIEEFFKKRDYMVSREKAIGKGRTVDLVLEMKNQRTAVELETGKSEAVYNIRKCLEAGFDKVLCVCLDEETKEKIESDIRKLNMQEEKINIILTNDLLKLSKLE